jgi:hypothetical protein
MVSAYRGVASARPRPALLCVGEKHRVGVDHGRKEKWAFLQACRCPSALLSGGIKAEGASVEMTDPFSMAPRYMPWTMVAPRALPASST